MIFFYLLGQLVWVFWGIFRENRSIFIQFFSRESDSTTNWSKADTV